MRIVAAGEFKAKCLKIMDEVAMTGEPVLVTKRGKPVVRLVAPASVEPLASVFGSLRGLATIVGNPEDLVTSPFSDAEWDRMLDESLNPALDKGEQ